MDPSEFDSPGFCFASIFIASVDVDNSGFAWSATNNVGGFKVDCESSEARSPGNAMVDSSRAPVVLQKQVLQNAYFQ